MIHQLNIFTTTISQPEISVQPPSKKLITARDLGLAAQFRRMAENMSEEIKAKLNSPLGDPQQHRLTARKLRIAKQQEKAGQQMQDVQSCLLAIASALEDGSLPIPLWGIRTKVQVEILLQYDEYEPSLEKANIFRHNFHQARQALFDTLENHHPAIDPEALKVSELRRLEQRIALAGIPGYFPTPSKVVEKMISHLQLQPGMKVLEPQAGAGHIADALKNHGCEVTCLEINPDLVSVLRLKGHQVLHQDCQDYRCEFPRIAMNPPFENCQDAIFIQHAYNHCLSRGGIMAAIASEGLFFRNTQTEINFQQWFKFNKGKSYKLGDAFKNSDRSTGIATRLLVLTK
ncbi:MAG TPA: rRNA adenine N-6-methyltransferase family protein [Nostocaceae cyanobacterium]|nr:rRNA adenine N-6-methyltransferase family protein [Nostocaceae cyanobacterium]